MGREAVVVEPGGRHGALRADRAVFTSIRSPMGEGYRLVACSAGITADERREITQRSPSHGSLCDASPAGRGLASYLLDSGRYCVACSRNAGLEHTARGGQRIHTDLAVLAPADFGRCGFDPWVLEVALLEQSERDRNLKRPPPHIEPLSIYPKWLVANDAGGLHRENLDQLANVLSLLLRRSSVIVADVPDPGANLRWLMTGLPWVCRKTFSASVGVKLSPRRNFQLLMVQATMIEARRFALDSGITLFDWNSPPPREHSPFDAWLRFVRLRWENPGLIEMDELCRMLNDASPEHLRRVAELCETLDRTELLDLAKWDSLLLSSSLPAGLLEELRCKMEYRRSCPPPAVYVESPHPPLPYCI